MWTVSLSRCGALLVMLTLLWGCNSTAKVTSYSVGKTELLHGKSAALEVKNNDTDTKAETVQATERIREQLTRELVSAGIFSSVVDAAAAAEYQVQVSVLSANVVSPGRRVMLGASAPRSEIQVAVQVRSSESQVLVKALHVSGYGGRMWLSPQGYGLDDLVREVVSNIVATLR